MKEPLAPSARTAPNLLAEQFDAAVTETLALVIMWSAREPHRVGEVATLPTETPVWLFGREPELPLMDPGGIARDEERVASARSPTARLPGVVRFLRQRPEHVDKEAPLPLPVAGESISRLQLHISHREEALFVQNVGRCQLLINGAPTQAAMVNPGDTLYLRNQLLLLCTRRPLRMPPLRVYPIERLGEFGTPDRDGMIGESPALWHLRERLASCARSDQNVLIVGESGSGKELAAQAIHHLSRRCGKPLVTDNISAIPPGLAAALLFGNKRNFPNPGMEERVGLIGSADGSMLFLDEIGDMPEEVQPMFLRVAERRGEYFRLGEEGRIRHSDFRLIGATNRPERMRYELKRRFQREIHIPSLNERKEDIPLLVRHLLRVQAQQHDPNALGFCDPQTFLPRVHPLLIDQLVRHTYVTNVSEVEFMLGHAMSESEGDILLPIRGSLPVQGRSARAPLDPLLPAAVSPTKRSADRPPSERVQRALDDAGGNVVHAAAALGLSRHQLNRLIRRYGVKKNRRLRADSRNTLVVDPDKND